MGADTPEERRMRTTNEHNEHNEDRWVQIVTLLLMVLAVGSRAIGNTALPVEPSAEHPMVVHAETKEIRLFGRIYAQRFNDAQREEAHYHLLVWNKGTSPTALIETPVDDLAFHTEVMKLGARPGNNLSMAAWTHRLDAHDTASHETVTGSALDIRIAWSANPSGVLISRVFTQSPATSTHPLMTWRFGGNRDRLFNQMPFGSRPGCLVCLYSCPSGKVSNSALSVHDYVVTPTRFVANTNLVPADGTPVIVTFRIHD
jgi:hypothetical protein